MGPPLCLVLISTIKTVESQKKVIRAMEIEIRTQNSLVGSIMDAYIDESTNSELSDDGIGNSDVVKLYNDINELSSQLNQTGY